LNQTKLILVEGLPGSGKSTTAQLIKEILDEMNVPSLLFFEGNSDHPADYEAWSYFPKADFTELLEKYKPFQSHLIKNAVPQLEGYVLSRNKFREGLSDESIPENLEKQLCENDIYELPFELNKQLITARWQAFADQAVKGETIYIFECCFIQNPVTIGMIKYDTEDILVMNYIKGLADIIEPLNPILIYIDQKDLRQSFLKAVKERPKEWSKGFVEYYNNQGFGKARGVIGVEGTLTVLDARKQFESNLYQGIEMEKVILDNSQFNKEQHQDELMKILNKIYGGYNQKVRQN